MRRREFVTLGAASAAIAAAGAKAAPQPGRDTHEPVEFGRARFQSLLTHRFNVSARGSLRAFPATLAAIEDGPAHPGLDQFSLLFRGTASLPQGLCWLSHANGTQFMLHLEVASVSSDQECRRATFSLLQAPHV